MSTPPVSPRAGAAATPTLPISVWRLAWQQAQRDFRAGELRLVLVAVMLAVAALTAVGFFADRLQAGLVRDAAQLLGGDAVVSSDQPVPASFEDEARRRGLATARTAAFPSMARAPDALGGNARLVAVKAVGEGYPLRGRLTVQATPGAPEQEVAERPARGEAWADAAVFETLGLKPGDPLLLGDAQLRLTRVIVLEPDRGGGFLNFAPRVLLTEEDLAATGLVQPASRVTYRLAVGGAQATAWAQWAGQSIQGQGLKGMRVESLEAGRPEMRQTLDRAEKFLNLVALLSALLAAVAVAIAARDFAQRHLDDCAMLRVLGLPQRRIAGAFSLEFVGLGLAASVAGVLLGLALHGLFVQLLGALVPARLPAPTPWPAVFGLGVGLTLLVGFGLPPVLQLARVPAVRVIRRDVGTLKAAPIGVLVAGAASFAALLLAVSQDLQLGAIAVGGFAAALAVFAVLAWLAVQALRRAVPEARAPRWLVLATRQIAARPAFTVLQVSSLAVGLMALALLVLLRTDLIDSWRAATPADAPNRFVINVMPDQAADFRAALAEAGVREGYDWFPMFRGRLVAINDQPTGERFAQDERARRTINREFNLSHSAEAPPHNRVVAGSWRPEETGAMSIEEGVAETLGVGLGDRLRFDVGGLMLDARITSIRRVDWGSMRANFFVLYPHAAMAELPITYMAAFRVPDGVAGFDGGISRRFPNVTLVDVSASLRQVQQVLDQVIRAVEFLFAFTLATGLAVLFAAISATREARSREYAVMRACGAGARLLGQVQRAELLGVGALAGLLATLAASVVAWALARYAFEFTWRASPMVPVAGMAAGAALALAAGWWSLRGLLRRPVLETLRRAGEV